MNEGNDMPVEAGDEVMKSVGELSATAREVAKSISSDQIDKEEVASWLKTILKTLIEVFK